MKLETRNLKLFPLITSFLILWATFAWSHSPEHDIETLEIIEIPGTAVILKERQFIFPKSDINDFPPLLGFEDLRISPEFHLNHNFKTDTVAHDPIGLKRGVKTPPKLIKMYTPPYPPTAKELDWEGTALLILNIEPDGTVSSAHVHTSSGHPFLDNFAIESTKNWLFEFKKDGEFPVKGKLKYPFHFHIDRPKN